MSTESRHEDDEAAPPPDGAADPDPGAEPEEAEPYAPQKGTKEAPLGGI